jgi:hypothetical protein
MPRIQWTDLPAPIRNHLFQRLADRKITAEDLYNLKLRRESDPDAPKDFGIKISIRSRFAVKADFRRRFF